MMSRLTLPEVWHLHRPEIAFYRCVYEESYKMPYKSSMDHHRTCPCSTYQETVNKSEAMVIKL